jgi:hypothetical protein
MSIFLAGTFRWFRHQAQIKPKGIAPSQSRFARRREDRPGGYRTARESAARASGESRESKRVDSKLRAENRLL